MTTRPHGRAGSGGAADGDRASPDPTAIEESEAPEAGIAPARLEGGSRKLGRYELVHELGVGGMASVFLARARGPAGFHKWFAIKRIHPHLAKDHRFVDMFLDEARIAASVHHPNVAQVFDLGAEPGEHYIAMEYLHGEHLGAVSVRAARELGRMPFEIAARMVSWAADGLHHAHEVRDPAGRPLHLVHRDVSPQNIFVTYDGSVRITDFGIAKAANRITHTHTGGMKGKSAYMAPEQALGQAVDRRSDIFALGIVLWEITTGRRLFKAETEAQTLLRITSGHVRAPSAVTAGYPPELEQIVMRALAAQPDHRYATAAAMARDLDRFVAKSGATAGATEVGALMQRLFRDRMSLKDDLLRADPAAPERVGTIVEIGSDDGVPREPSRSRVKFREGSASGGAREAPRRSRRLLASVALSVALALAAAAGIAWSALGAATSMVRIDSVPAGARIVLDGAPTGQTTPALLESVQHGTHRVRLELEAHEITDATFELDGARVDLIYRLAAASEAGSAAPTEVAVAGAEAATETRATIDPSTSPSRDAPSPSPSSRARTARDETRARDARPTAFLNLITRPWAAVTINGREAGTTPLVAREVPAGRLVIRLRAEGTGPERTIRRRAAAGQTLSERIDL